MDATRQFDELTDPYTVGSVPFEYDEGAHAYTIGGVRVPSVTQVLAAVGISDFSGISPDTLQYAADRGTAVHRFCEFLDQDDSEWSQIAGTAIEPYCRAYERFKADARFKPRMIEQRGVSQVNGQRYGYCVDREGDFGGHATVVDLKTGAPSRSWPIQLAAYERALFLEDGRHRKRMAVQLLDDGNWRPIPYTDPLDAHVWTWALALTTWKQNNQ